MHQPAFSPLNHPRCEQKHAQPRHKRCFLRCTQAENKHPATGKKATKTAPKTVKAALKPHFQLRYMYFQPGNAYF